MRIWFAMVKANCAKKARMKSRVNIFRIASALISFSRRVSTKYSILLCIFQPPLLPSSKVKHEKAEKMILRPRPGRKVTRFLKGTKQRGGLEKLFVCLREVPLCGGEEGGRGSNALDSAHG